MSCRVSLEGFFRPASSPPSPPPFSKPHPRPLVCRAAPFSSRPRHLLDTKAAHQKGSRPPPRPPKDRFSFFFGGVCVWCPPWGGVAAFVRHGSPSSPPLLRFRAPVEPREGEASHVKNGSRVHEVCRLGHARLSLSAVCGTTNQRRRRVGVTARERSTTVAGTSSPSTPNKTPTGVADSETRRQKTTMAPRHSPPTTSSSSFLSFPLPFSGATAGGPAILARNGSHARTAAPPFLSATAWQRGRTRKDRPPPVMAAAGHPHKEEEEAPFPHPRPCSIASLAGGIDRVDRAKGTPAGTIVAPHRPTATTKRETPLS